MRGIETTTTKCHYVVVASFNGNNLFLNTKMNLKDFKMNMAYALEADSGLVVLVSIVPASGAVGREIESHRGVGW
jgi:hypothetical protein